MYLHVTGSEVLNWIQVGQDIIKWQLIKGSALRDRRGDFSTRTVLHGNYAIVVNVIGTVVYLVVIKLLFFIILFQGGFETVLSLKVTTLFFLPYPPDTSIVSTIHSPQLLKVRR